MQLAPWCGRLTVHVVPFTEIQEEIRRSCPEESLHPHHAPVHDASGGCAWPTSWAAAHWSPASAWARWPARPWRPWPSREDVATLPVLRPLIGMDKEEIVRIARHIGTFDTSILPYEDCCTVFTPRHPKTKPHVEEVREMEQTLDVAGLVPAGHGGPGHREDQVREGGFC